jgi:hypothetical protein
LFDNLLDYIIWLDYKLKKHALILLFFFGIFYLLFENTRVIRRFAANVVVYGKVGTGRGPATAMEFALTLVEQLYGDRDGKVFGIGEVEALA